MNADHRQPGAAAPGGHAIAVAGGAALFLAGNALFRRALRIGPDPALRPGRAVFALATAALGATVAIEAQLAVLLAGMVAMLGADTARTASPQAPAALSPPAAGE